MNIHADEFVAGIRSAFRAGDPEVDRKTVEAGNVRCLEEQYAAIVRGDFDAVVEFMTDDVELQIVGPAGAAFAGQWRGMKEVAEALRNNFSQLDELRPELQSVTAQGDTVVVCGRDRGVFRPTGRAYDLHWVQVFGFRDSRVARIREIADSASILEAVGSPGG